MSEQGIGATVPFQAMYDADTAVMALQGTGATDADKTQAAVRAALPTIHADLRERLEAEAQDCREVAARYGDDYEGCPRGLLLIRAARLDVIAEEIGGGDV